MNIKEKLQKAEDLILNVEDGSWASKIRKNIFDQEKHDEIKALLSSINKEINEADEYPYDDALNLTSLMTFFYSDVASYIIDKKSPSDAINFVSNWAMEIGNIHNHKQGK